MLIARPYQNQSVNAGVSFFKGPSVHPAFQILPTGSGKSLIIALIAKALQNSTLVLQPSKEILEQNYLKYSGYGFRAGIYSASLNSNHVDHTTFATIGSIIKKTHLFRDVRNIIIDECHLVNAEDGMYSELIRKLPQAKVMGLTATPYRLTSTFEGAQLKFINQTRPRIFRDCLYYIQNDVLFNAGHLSKLEYYDFKLVDRSLLDTKGDGSDFSEASMRAYSREHNIAAKIINISNQLLQKRKNLLVFCASIIEAKQIQRGVPGSVVISSETDYLLRATYLKQFKSGVIRCVINVGVLTTGFDYPELETVLLGRSTMSLSLYYQIVGRGMRPHDNKASCHIIDIGGNVEFFGKIETMQIREYKRELSVWNNGRKLTDTPLQKMAA